MKDLNAAVRALADAGFEESKQTDQDGIVDAVYCRRQRHWDLFGVCELWVVVLLDLDVALQADHVALCCQQVRDAAASRVDKPTSGLMGGVVGIAVIHAPEITPGAKTLIQSGIRMPFGELFFAGCKGPDGIIRTAHRLWGGWIAPKATAILVAILEGRSKINEPVSIRGIIWMIVFILAILGQLYLFLG